MGFGLMTMFLVGMQAAGVAINLWDYHKKRELTKMGAELEQAGIDTNIELARTEAAQESVASIEALKQNMGAQIAIQAARGTATNVGSALFIQEHSIHEYNQDERTRELNLRAKESSLRANKAFSALKALGVEEQQASSITNRLLNMLPVSSLADRAFGSFASTAQTSRSAVSAATRAASRASFGLQPAQV